MSYLVDFLTFFKILQYLCYLSSNSHLCICRFWATLGGFFQISRPPSQLWLTSSRWQCSPLPRPPFSWWGWVAPRRIVRCRHLAGTGLCSCRGCGCRGEMAYINNSQSTSNNQWSIIQKHHDWWHHRQVPLFLPLWDLNPGLRLGKWTYYQFPSLVKYH